MWIRWICIKAAVGSFVADFFISVCGPQTQERPHVRPFSKRFKLI
jgi:hypothetical protein